MENTAIAPGQCSETRSTSARLWFCSVIIAAISFVVFANTMASSFVWDDEHFIQRNVYLTSASYLPRLVTQNTVAGAGMTGNLYRPLQSLTHFLDVCLWDNKPWGHHLTNLLLYSIAAALVFRWLCEFAPISAALAIAALYSVHPLQSEAVAYVSGRGDSMAILFMCLALILFKKWLWLSLLCALAAVLSKESMAMFPVFLWLHVQAAGLRSSWRRQVPFWILSGSYVVLRLTVLNFDNTLNFYGAENVLSRNIHYRLFTYLTTLPEGLRLWFWPSDLHHERSWSVYASITHPRVWLSALAVLAWVSASVWAWRRRRSIGAGLLWFLAATIPTSNLIVLINALFYDHWFILPGLGLALVLSQVLPVEGKWRNAALGSCAIMVAVLAWTTWHHNRVWRDPLSLNSHILEYEPNNAKIHNNLAMALSDEGRLGEAIRHYQRAISLNDQYPQTHHNLARAYERLGRVENAATEYRRALQIDPDFYHSQVALGGLELRQGRRETARLAFEQAIRAYPYAVSAYLGLAQIELDAGQFREAEAVLRRGLERIDDPRLRAALARIRSTAPTGHPSP